MQSVLAQQLGRRIKAVRIAQRLTQERLAERIGKSIGLVGQIERGEAMPSVDTLLDIFRALGVSPDSILGDLVKEDNNNISCQVNKLLSAMERDEQCCALDLVQRFADFLKLQRSR